MAESQSDSELIEDEIQGQHATVHMPMSACSPLGTDEELEDTDDDQLDYSTAKKDEVLVVVSGENVKPKSAIFKLMKSSHHKPRIPEVKTDAEHAIADAGPLTPDLPPQDYLLEENEERSMIEPQSYEDPKLKTLISLLTDWVNDQLAAHRIIVRDIEEDLYDGQVLQRLTENLTGEKLDAVEVAQSEEGQKQKLKLVLETIHKYLELQNSDEVKWNEETIHSKNLISTLHLLVALATHSRAPIRLPENVVINLVVVQKKDGLLQTRRVPEEITGSYDDLGLQFERDAFDILFEDSPEKLDLVKTSLITFVNSHLIKVNLEVEDLELQFRDGVYLNVLLGLLEGYFVPLYSFYPTPTTFEQKVHNVALSFELIQDAGLSKPKARPEDIVNGDLKSTLRVLHNLFNKYKQI